MGKREYYEVMGVSRDASPEEVKKSYRQLARKYHPDVTTEDPKVAEERFKEISEAYEVLADVNKRKLYDQYGHSGVDSQFSGGGFSWDDFSHYSDLNDIFGGNFSSGGSIFDFLFSGGGRQRRGGSQQGSSLRYDIEITLEDVLNGMEQEVSIPRSVACEDCNGTGGKDGNVTTCPQCNGNGQVQQVRSSTFGRFMSVTTCPQCHGSGRTYAEACPQCKGQGHVQRTSRIDLDIPAGVENGTRFRVPGAGDAGAHGGPPGDLFVVVHVRQHDVFSREGSNLWMERDVTFPQATLGAEVEVITLQDETVRLKVPAGTQPDEVLRLRGKGLPRLGSGSHGDMLIRVRLVVPKKVTQRQRECLEAFAEDEGKHKGFLRFLKH